MLITAVLLTLAAITPAKTPITPGDYVPPAPAQLDGLTRQFPDNPNKIDVLLDWQGSKGSTYQIYRHDSVSNQWYLYNPGHNDTEPAALDTHTMHGVTYGYKVIAVAPDGEMSDFSNEFDITIP